MKLVPVHYRQLVKVFEAAGWQYKHTVGDHMVYKKPGAIRAVVIPK